VAVVPGLKREVSDTLAGLIAEIIFGTYFTIASAIKNRIRSIPAMTMIRTNIFGFFGSSIVMSLINLIGY
jgi:hypothetical protein